MWKVGDVCEMLTESWLVFFRGCQFEDVPNLVNWVVVSNMFYFHPENWGKIPILTHIFQMG